MILFSCLSSFISSCRSPFFFVFIIVICLEHITFFEHIFEQTLHLFYCKQNTCCRYCCCICSYIQHTHTEPITEILGGPDLFLNKGSTINLTCIVRFAPEPSPTLSWAHNREVCKTIEKLIPHLLY